MILILSLVVLAAPASGFITVHEDLNLVACADDDNDYHIDAADLEHISIGVNTVCATDTHDWYRFQGEGHVNWVGSLRILTTEPGLRVNLYFDEGGGVQEVYDGTPEYVEVYGMHFLQLSIDDLVDDAGFYRPLQGNFYIRISYYSAYPGNHPYLMQSIFQASPAKPPVFNWNIDAEEIPIGEDRYCTLTQTDFYRWYYWEHPAGELMDGVIELYTMREEADPNAPDISIKIFSGSVEIPPGVHLDADRRYADLDLSQMGLNPGTYVLRVALETPTNDPVIYRLRNRATMGYLDGCGSDSNNSPAVAIGLSDNYPYSTTLCHPRDSEDYYTYTHDRYFIGDFVISPQDGRKAIFAEITKGTNQVPIEGESSILGESFYKKPLYPGKLDIKVIDYFGATEPMSYEITVHPDGAGAYRTPGHASWQSADDMLQYDQVYHYRHSYWFELEPTHQDRYCFSTSTGPGEYLTGIVEIYGSQLDYEVRIGQLGPTGPAWAAPIYPDEKGKTTLDFGYGILSEPGDYILRVKLNDTVTGRRRFYMTQDIEIMECGETPADSFANPGGMMNTGAYISTMNGALCPPDDNVDFGSFTISSDAGEPVGPGYFLNVKAGYPDMTFKLYDAFHTELWSAHITELGGTASVKLVDTTYFEGHEYWLEVTTNSTQEQLMLWRAQFMAPLAPIFVEAYPVQGSGLIIDIRKLLGEVIEGM